VTDFDSSTSGSASSTPRDTLRNWKLAGFVASIVIVLTIPFYAWKESGRRSAEVGPSPAASSAFVGRSQCIDCHQDAYEAWRGSHHDLAMAEASDSTVLGDFNDTVFETDGVITRFFRRDEKYLVHTEGPDGEMGDFEVAYTFGAEPLQQYLIPFPGGRIQCLTIAWDVEGQRWFDLYPDDDFPAGDWLHWTQNGQNWNGMCAECHSTNLQKNYDPESRTFSTTWSEIDVSCEACHGPGSEHVEWAEITPMARPEIENYGLLVETNGIPSRNQVELCAPCHSRRTELGDYDHVGADLFEDLIPAVLDEGLYHADGQIREEVYVYGSFVQSKMHRNDVGCSDCHDVHSLELKAEGNELCLQCHTAEAYDTYDHHFHKKIHEDKPSDGALCIKCHMPEQPFMVIDERADHSLRVPRPDLSIEIGTPNACSQNGCHGDKPVQWAADHYTEWYGKARRPHYGTLLHAGREGKPEAKPGLIRLAGDPLQAPIVRATALTLLRQYDGDDVRQAVASALSEEEPLLRYTATQSVSASRPEELVELLAPLLLDPSIAVRRQAAVQLAPLPAGQLLPYQSEALAEALTGHKKAMEHSLDFAFAGHNLGNLQASLGQTEEAERYYRQSLEIDDLFYPAKMNLAILCSQQGRNEEAEALLREVVEAYPEVYDAAYSLGLLLVETGQQHEAAKLIEQAAQGMPEASRVHYNLGLLQQSLGEDLAAEARLLHALTVEPRNMEYLYALVDFYIKRGRYDEALPMADRMIAEQPEAQIGHEMKALILRATGSTQD